MTLISKDNHLTAGAWATCAVNLPSRNILYQLSYLMSIERGTNAKKSEVHVANYCNHKFSRDIHKKFLVLQYKAVMLTLTKQ